MADSTSQVTRWSKGILVTFWLVQDIILLIILVLQGSQLRFADIDSGWTFLSSSIIALMPPIIILLSSISIILNITEPILLTKHKLLPTVYFIFQLIKTISWTVAVALSIFYLVEEGREFGWEIEWFIEFTIMLISVLASLVYSSIVFHHRHQRAKTEATPWRKPELEDTGKEGQSALVELEHPERAIPELENCTALAELATRKYNAQELGAGYPWLELEGDQEKLTLENWK